MFTSSASAARPWAPSPPPCASRATPSPARTTTVYPADVALSSRSKGIKLSEGYQPENLPADADLIVVGNAISRGNPEIEAVLNRKLYYLSLPETLKQFFLRGRHNLVVTGTHGKTTTTSLLTWILQSAGLNPAYMIGGIAEESRPGLQPARFEACRHRGRRIRHRLLRQALEVPPLPARTRHREQHRVRPRRHLRRPRRDQAQLPPHAQHRAGERHGADQRRRPELHRRRRELPRPARRSRLLARTPRATSATSRTTPHGSRIHAARHAVLASSCLGEFNVRNAAMAISAAHFYGVPLDNDRQGRRRVRGREAPAGSARRSARHHRHRRLRPSSHRHPRDPARPAPPISRRAASGPSSSRARTPRAAPSSSTNSRRALPKPTARSSPKSRAWSNCPPTTASTPRRSSTDIAADRQAGLLRARRRPPSSPACKPLVKETRRDRDLLATAASAAFTSGCSRSCNQGAGMRSARYAQRREPIVPRCRGGSL